jgi:hypothetical protein
MSKPPRITSLEDLERIPGPDTLTWLPVRATLDIHAFGANAYIASAAGDDVVEPHTEGDAGHEELYFVARGRARFTIDGESYDAPAGTYVFIPDPESHRRAVAEEAGTTVLSFGGPPSFTPSAWEWTFRASALRRSDPRRARDVLEDGLRAHPEGGGLFYELACLEVADGGTAAALEALAQAVRLRPETREWAREDPDLAPLREEPGFAQLTSG